jgi:hypothetical protein
MHHQRQEEDVGADLYGELSDKIRSALQDRGKGNDAEDDVAGVGVEVGVPADGAEWNVLTQRHDGHEQHQRRSKTVNVEIEQRSPEGITVLPALDGEIPDW